MIKLETWVDTFEFDHDPEKVYGYVYLVNRGDDGYEYMVEISDDTRYFKTYKSVKNYMYDHCMKKVEVHM
jgi:hypothetical protein